MTAFNASLAGSVAWLAAVELEGADVVFFSAGSDVLADHETTMVP